MSGVDLAALRSGQRVRGLVAGEAVTLIVAEPLGGEVYELFWRDDAGATGQRLVTPADAAALHVETRQRPFDADAGEFRLAAEALRISHAALYDPMVAVSTSDVDPLPHQIRAVYEELLPRIPLRFLLADDPGAGKTIMAGLYLKELILRSDCERALVVAPGGLVEQWREELAEKFDLHFEVFGRHMVDDAQGRNVFAEHPWLIARMDQVSRDEDLMEQLADVRWDAVVVDEAHRMSAHYSSWDGEIKATARFELGSLLSQTAHNFLLMTATPHAGKEEDFQLFCSLLDPDRFAGRYRKDVHRTDTDGLMRRMVKEDLLTFEGKPLFPERRAYTVAYELSPAERDLYDRVTEYVRTEMGRADTITDNKRRNNVGFALTVLQRRLASSPEAIWRSLERRQRRLEEKLRDMQRIADAGGSPDFLDDALVELAGFDALDEEVTAEERARFEEDVEEVVDLATAARTIPELRAEITILADLVGVARRVRHADEDKKWVELSTILDENLLGPTARGRKLIVFTEHRDTLDYLRARIAARLGRAESVLTIHGGTRREERRLARERFTHDPDTVVLLATDAAGEGLNLQRAHLMVNYDLPWNPNRIEQRFGRIHRIGQREVCHLWNLVAKDTREGDVFVRLLGKIAAQSAAYNGNLFHVLGGADAFQDQPLRDLLVEAIRYGDRPEKKAELEQIIDAGVANGLDELVRERALHPEMYSALHVAEVRARMEEARERRLQPGYIAMFFHSAFDRLGGRLARRERGRFEITRVPPRVIDAARRRNRWAPVAERYERVTFDRDRMHPDGLSDAELLAPGHPLLDAVLEVTIADLESTLARGTVLVDRRAAQADELQLLFTVEQRIHDAAGRTVSHHFDHPLLGPDDALTVVAAPPYLDFDPPEPHEWAAIDEMLREAWVRADHDKVVRAGVHREALEPQLAKLRARVRAETDRTRAQVKTRLDAEINHWDGEYNRLEALERQGTVGRVRAEAARERSQELERRLAGRMAELDAATDLVPVPPVIRGAALVIPSARLQPDDGDAAAATRGTTLAGRREVEHRAVDAVLAIERALGHDPVEMSPNHKGFDISCRDTHGFLHYLEVKGRIAGSDTFTITTHEIAFAQNQGDRHHLALVEVSPDGPAHDRIRYVGQAFDHLQPAVTTRSFIEKWADYWHRGEPMSPTMKETP